MNLIEVKNLSVGYNHKAIVENISFTVNEGNAICIIGENGIGKSTLMKTLLGVLKPVSGEIIFSENKRFGYLPQINETQNDFPASVNEIVLSGLLNKKSFLAFYNKADKEIAMKNMEILHITHLKDKPFSSLSGGQKQRVLIARALCSTDNILFLDEPITGLDPQTKADFYETLALLQKEGITIVMITHNLEDFINEATHVLVVAKESKFLTKEEYLKEAK